MRVLSYLAWAAMLLACAIGGFVVVSRHLDDGNVDALELESVNQEFHLDRKSLLPGVLVSGWTSAGWGATMRDKTAVAQLAADAPSIGDVDMTLEGRLSGGDGTTPAKIHLELNGDKAGVWELHPGEDSRLRHFIVQRDTFNRSSDLQLKLTLDAPPNAKFTLRSVIMRDVRLVEFKGVIDACSATGIEGWATADGTPAVVRFKVGGQPAQGEANVVLRPDLAKRGYRPESGYRFVFAAPLPSGTAVEASFYDGKKLSKSPCKIP